MRNDARYNAAGRAELAPLIDETLVNFDAWAAIGSATLTLENRRDPGRLSSGFVGRYALARTRVFGATDDLQEGRDTSQFAVLRADVGGPTAWSRHGERVLWDVFGDWTGLYDVDDETLGFDEFYQLGAGLSLRVTRRVPPLRLGAAWVVGQDIRGWSLGVTLGS